MTVSFTAANNAVSVKPIDIITAAMTEIGALAAGEMPSAEDSAWCLQKLQRLIDRFNAQSSVIFNTSFTLYTLTANHGPHTIGPSGDFNVPIRPVRLISCSFVLNSSGSNPVHTPVNIRDAQWWAANPLKSLTSSIVTDVFYDAGGPLGSLNFYPICNVANPVRLETWDSLAQAVDLTTALGFVQGYWDAIVLTLAVELLPSYEKPPNPVLLGLQQKAMRIIEANNEPPPQIRTDAGMPESRGAGRPDFNFLTGMRE